MPPDSSRAQLIEVCTEASLQPIFQFYLVFQDFALDTEKWSLDLANGLVVPIEYNRRQGGNSIDIFDFGLFFGSIFKQSYL